MGEGNVTVAAGWFADPGGAPVLRYWDGAAWTPYIAVPQNAVSPRAALARERAVLLWARRAWLLWPVLVVVNGWSTIESWASRGDEVFRRGDFGARFWIGIPVSFAFLGLTVLFAVWGYRAAVVRRPTWCPIAGSCNPPSACGGPPTS